MNKQTISDGVNIMKFYTWCMVWLGLGFALAGTDALAQVSPEIQLATRGVVLNKSYTAGFADNWLLASSSRMRIPTSGRCFIIRFL